MTAEPRRDERLDGLRDLAILPDIGHPVTQVVGYSALAIAYGRCSRRSWTRLRPRGSAGPSWWPSCVRSA